MPESSRPESSNSADLTEDTGADTRPEKDTDALGSKEKEGVPKDDQDIPPDHNQSPPKVARPILSTYEKINLKHCRRKGCHLPLLSDQSVGVFCSQAHSDEDRAERRKNAPSAIKLIFWGIGLFILSIVIPTALLQLFVFIMSVLY